MTTWPPTSTSATDERFEPDDAQSESDLRRFFGVVRRRLPFILAAFILLPLAVFVGLHQVTRKYTAEATLIFQGNAAEQQAAGLTPVAQTTDPEGNVQRATLGDTAALTAKRIGNGLTAARVRHILSIQAVGNTAVVTVAATAPNAKFATRVANTYCTIFVSHQNSASRDYYSNALSVVTKQLAQIPDDQRNDSAALALETKVQSLSLLSQLSSSGVQFAQRANDPTSPSSPKIAQDTVIAAVLGLMLGIAIAFGIDGLDRKIRDPAELEEIFELPLLGAIPASSAFTKPGTGAQHFRARAAVGDSFQLVHAHLRYFNVDRELKAILVTSGAAGDGKSTISSYLAAAAAQMGSSVLLVEADLRRPTLARALAINPGPGLTDALLDPDELVAAIQTVSLGPDSGGDGDGEDGGPTIDVLVAGQATPPNPVLMLESQAMDELIAYGKRNYDLVLVDTPPVTVVSDVFSMLRHVDGVLLVGRVGKSDRKMARRASETLHGAGAELLGVVANEVKGDSRYYGAYSAYS